MTANAPGRKRNSDQNTTSAVLVHIAGLFFGFFAILFIYVVSSDEFTKANAINALNWHVPISLLAIVVVIIGIGVSELTGVAMAVIIAVATVCVSLIAGVKAYHGQAWQYPISPQIF